VSQDQQDQRVPQVLPELLEQLVPREPQALLELMEQ